MSQRERDSPGGGAAPFESTPGSPPSHDETPRFYRELSIPLLAHELKGPLAVIETGIRALLDRGAGETEARRERTLRRVLRSALRARALVDDLLEIGRAEAGLVERTPFEPAAALLDAVIDAVEAMDTELTERLGAAPDGDLLATLAGGGVEVAIAEPARSMALDQDQRKFSIVAANLVRNALRFRRTRVVVSLAVEGEAVRLTVEDDGPGVPQQDRDRIFERWVRGDPEAGSGRQGHGLGLAASRLLARAMGGDVTLEGREGSRFVLVIPRAR